MFTYTKNTFIALFVLVGLTACLGEQTQNVTIETADGTQHSFSVNVADDPKEKEKGLMFVEEMPKDEGMLFVYPEPDRVLFWMKNTLIPLDMLFFDAQNRLIYIEHNAQPHDETPRGPSNKVCSVLEINGGLAKELGIEIGATLLTNATEECLQSAVQ